MNDPNLWIHPPHAESNRIAYCRVLPDGEGSFDVGFEDGRAIRVTAGDIQGLLLALDVRDIAALSGKEVVVHSNAAPGFARLEDNVYVGQISWRPTLAKGDGAAGT